MIEYNHHKNIMTVGFFHKVFFVDDLQTCWKNSLKLLAMERKFSIMWWNENNEYDLASQFFGLKGIVYIESYTLSVP